MSIYTWYSGTTNQLDSNVGIEGIDCEYCQGSGRAAIVYNMPMTLQNPKNLDNGTLCTNSSRYSPMGPVGGFLDESLNIYRVCYVVKE